MKFLIMLQLTRVSEDTPYTSTQFSQTQCTICALMLTDAALHDSQLTSLARQGGRGGTGADLVLRSKFIPSDGQTSDQPGLWMEHDPVDTFYQGRSM